MAFIRNVMICAAVLLLAAYYSTGNPVPQHRRSDQQCGQNQASESTCPDHELWTIDTNSTKDSVTQITNGISVYIQITPPGGPVLSEPSLVCIINCNIASEYTFYLIVWCISVYSAAGGQGVHPRSADRLPDALPLPSI